MTCATSWPRRSAPASGCWQQHAWWGLGGGFAAPEASFRAHARLCRARARKVPSEAQALQLRAIAVNVKMVRRLHVHVQDPAPRDSDAWRLVPNDREGRSIERHACQLGSTTPAVADRHPPSADERY